MGARQQKVSSMQGAQFCQQVLEGLLTSNIGFAVFDRWFRYRIVNETLAAMHRVPAEAHAGEGLRKITGAAGLKIEPALDAVFATGKGVRIFELIGNVPRRPEAIHWTGTHFPIRDGHRKVKEVGAFVVDVGSEVQHVAANRANKRLLETVTINTHRIQDLLLRLFPRNERSLTGAESERIIDGATEAIGKCECRPENGSTAILSHREQEIVCFLANGMSNKEISATLEISVKTVECYRSRVFFKLKLGSLASLVRYAIRNRIVEL
jgi:DNA-binding CsgD family transcriptional regulator